MSNFTQCSKLSCICEKYKYLYCCNMPLPKRTPNVRNFEELEHTEDFFSLEGICVLKRNKQKLQKIMLIPNIRMSISLMKLTSSVKNFISDSSDCNVILADKHKKVCPWRAEMFDTKVLKWFYCRCFSTRVFWNFNLYFPPFYPKISNSSEICILNIIKRTLLVLSCCLLHKNQKLCVKFINQHTLRCWAKILF